MDVSEQPRVGQPVNRKEDDRLLTGGGRYTDDVSFPNQTFGYFLRSAYAHGAIRRIDTRAARTAPRVIAVYTAADLAPAGYGYPPCPAPITSLDGTPVIVPPRPLLASARVRYVGEPVALVVAASPMAPRDAAERIELDVEPLPVVTDMAAALEPDAPRLHDEAPGNLCLDWRFGDFDAIEKAIAGAAHVTRLRIENNRVVALPLEPRAAVAEFDAAADRFTL
ncbi:MAG: xanthine dehydrogenase family protein molybdopterin-binding subunit, partial [Alphaproteobacteria bacterium]